LRYTGLLFDLDPFPGDRHQPHAGLTAAAADPRHAGWATFWLGVLADNTDNDPGSAAPTHQRAFTLTQQDGDTLLESYAVRHLGDHSLDHDRDQGYRPVTPVIPFAAPLGAGPQTAPAAFTLAGELSPGPEADLLRETARLAARELRLTWLTAAIHNDHEHANALRLRGPPRRANGRGTLIAGAGLPIVALGTRPARQAFVKEVSMFAVIAATVLAPLMLVGLAAGTICVRDWCGGCPARQRFSAGARSNDMASVT
jgi:hypothetical protein